MMKYLRAHWRDFATLGSVFLLILVSIYEKYQIGMLVGFLMLIVFLSYERIKRIIVELNVKKIYGIEFGEIEREEMIEGLKAEIEARGIPLEENQIENVADMALNQVRGIAYKGRYYEELVGYALKDLNERHLKQFSGVVGDQVFNVDFLVELDDSRVVGIEAVYSDHRYLSKNKLLRIKQVVSVIKKADNLVGFALITNAEVKDSDRGILADSAPRIVLIDRTISPDGVLSRLKVFLDEFKKGNESNKENPADA